MEGGATFTTWGPGGFDTDNHVEEGLALLRPMISTSSQPYRAWHVEAIIDCLQKHLIMNLPPAGRLKECYLAAISPVNMTSCCMVMECAHLPAVCFADKPQYEAWRQGRVGLSYHGTRLRYAETNRRTRTVSCSESEKFKDLLADEPVMCWALNGYGATGWRLILLVRVYGHERVYSSTEGDRALSFNNRQPNSYCDVF